jgi:hypothetical protein
MLTLFSVPKPFRSHIGIIQANALQSWLRLRPQCEVVLFAAEEGTAQMAAQFGALHVPEVSRNEFGTPLLNDLFEKAQQIASYPLVCYVNADIILLDDFARSVESLRRLKQPFLMVGRRWNVDLTEPVGFESPTWSDSLQRYARERGHLGSQYYIDYFVFPKGLFRNIPPFVIGRPAFDNWLLWRARSLGASLIDASQVVLAIHQNHDYAHHPRGRAGVYEGPEAKRNRELMDGSHHFFTLEDATHYLTAAGLKRNFSPRYFRRKWKFARRALRHKLRQQGTWANADGHQMK